MQVAGERLARELGALVAGEVAVGEAQALVGALARWERMLGAARVALVRRVTEAEAHVAVGGRDPVTYCAQVSGTSRGKARAELDLAERLAELPVVEAALRTGRISADQARIIAPAAHADPAATPELLGAADAQSLNELRQMAARRTRAARGEGALEDQERHCHERRYCRTFASAQGGVRLEAWVGTLQGAALVGALEKKTAELATRSHEPHERLAADALVALLGGGRAVSEVVVRVDAGALVRGEVGDGETCEVPGIGPVSLRAARGLLGEAFVTLLVTKGHDVAAVTSTSRFVPRAVRKALFERDRCCVVPGCGATFGLEIDHWRLDFARHGPTELANLCRLCSVHHRQKTDGLIVLAGGPGRWVVRPGPRAGWSEAAAADTRRRRAAQAAQGRRARREAHVARRSDARAGP